MTTLSQLIKNLIAKQSEIGDTNNPEVIINVGTTEAPQWRRLTGTLESTGQHRNAIHLKLVDAKQ